MMEKKPNIEKKLGLEKPVPEKKPVDDKPIDDQLVVDTQPIVGNQPVEESQSPVSDNSPPATENPPPVTENPPPVVEKPQTVEDVLNQKPGPIHKLVAGIIDTVSVVIAAIISSPLAVPIWAVGLTWLTLARSILYITLAAGWSVLQLRLISKALADARKGIPQIELGFWSGVAVVALVAILGLIAVFVFGL